MLSKCFVVPPLRLIILGLTFLVSLGFTNATCAQAPNVYYVGPTGADGNNGETAITPFKTIGHAFSKLSTTGGTIRVLPGDYYPCESWDRSSSTCIGIGNFNVGGDSSRTLTIERFVPLNSPNPNQPARFLGTFVRQSHYLNQSPNPSAPPLTFHRMSPAQLTSAPPHANAWILIDDSIGLFRSAIPIRIVPDTGVETDIHLNRAAFLNPIYGRYTRLVGYSYMEDLKALNERSGIDCVSASTTTSTEGYVVHTNNEVCETRRGIRPHTYAGPGVYYEQSTGYLFARFAQTNNGVVTRRDFTVAAFASENPSCVTESALSAYVNPNCVPILVTGKADYRVFTIGNSKYVTVRGLTIILGTTSILVGESNHVTIDGNTILGGNTGFNSGSKDHTTLIFKNNRVDGGTPDWFFRSDLKGDYCRLIPSNPNSQCASPGQDVEAVAKANLHSLARFHANQINSEITHNEFVRGHDLYLNGSDFRFERNWIYDIHDDVFFFEAGGVAKGIVSDNVIEKSLSVVAYNEGIVGDRLGPVTFLRNLFDLREPTANQRPLSNGAIANHPQHVFEYGYIYKTNGINNDGKPTGEPSTNFFHNTLITKSVRTCEDHHPIDSSCKRAKGGVTKFRFFSEINYPNTQHLSYNNIFVTFVSDTLSGQTPPDEALAYLPHDPTPDRASNGNLYFRYGLGSQLFYSGRRPDGVDRENVSCNQLPFTQTSWYQRSINGGAPLEANGLLCINPQFRNIEPPISRFDRPLDFRLRFTWIFPGLSSPALNASVPLPPYYAHLQKCYAFLSNAPIPCNLGAYANWWQKPMKVGVHERIKRPITRFQPTIDVLNYTF
jgi:hypothetical protein